MPIIPKKSKKNPDKIPKNFRDYYVRDYFVREKFVALHFPYHVPYGKTMVKAAATAYSL